MESYLEIGMGFLQPQTTIAIDLTFLLGSNHVHHKQSH